MEIDVDGSPRSELLRLDAVGEEFVERYEVGPGGIQSGLVAHEDALFFRYSGSPLAGAVLHGVEFVHPDGDERSDWVKLLLRFDPSTGVVTDQYEYVKLGLVDNQPLILVDGTFVYPEVASFSTFINVRSGESQVNAAVTGLVRDWFVDGETLWVAHRDSITEVDLRTQAQTGFYRSPTWDAARAPLDDTLRAYDGGFWVSDIDEDVDNAYELLLPEGVLGEPVPVGGIPTVWREWGAYRWELINGRWWQNLDDDPGLDDVWRQVEIESGDVLAEFNFGEFRPAFGDTDALWLVERDADGDRLARLDLS